MMCFLQLCSVMAVLVLGTATAAFADLSKLLEPVGGATLGRPGASLERPDNGSGAGGGAGGAGVSPRSADRSPVASKAPMARIITTETPQKLTELELVQGIQNDLPKRFDVQGDLRVSLVKRWVPLQLPASDFFAECVQLPPTGLSSNMNVTVRGVSGGKIVGEWPLQIKVELYQRVWVAAQRLESGQVLENGLITSQPLDVLRETAQPLPVERELSGFELAQAVSKGRALTRRDLVERALVKRGQFVDAFAGEGGFSVRMRALAMEGGAAGAVIRVRNLDTKKEFYAQVINENQVQVRF
jgi:flagella basal body P-ring formation protein FlgA